MPNEICNVIWMKDVDIDELSDAKYMYGIIYYS